APGAGVTGDTVTFTCRSGFALHGSATATCQANGSWSASPSCAPLAGTCTADADCAPAGWCNFTSYSCQPRVANGERLPTDPTPPSPALDGTCAARAAAIVCTSGVCDADDRCGFANDHGFCTAENAATVCRSGVCGGDGRCGYPDAE